MTKIAWAILPALLSWSACGDKESSKSTNANANGEPNAVFCQIGTSGCGCSGSFPCTTEGEFCVDEVCKPCPKGDEHCACNDDQTCNGALACVVPDPDCTALCEPATCEVAGANNGGTCGPTELCARTINDCGETLTQESCELFYADMSNCADMAQYTTCNCDCMAQDTCENYFACGQNCFNDHCN